METPFLEKEIRLGSEKWCKNKSYRLHKEVCVQDQFNVQLQEPDAIICA